MRGRVAVGNRQVVPLLFGAGLDRATGILSREGRSGSDLRNIYLYRDKAQVRRGHAVMQTLTDESGDPLADVPLVTALEAEQVGIVAGYGSDGRVHLFRVSGDGTTMVRVGTLFTVPTVAYAPPRLTSCEQYKKLFVAHDEPNLFWRQPTTYYNPWGVPAIAQLSADLDGDTVAGPVYFRGVAPYLQYLVGWGYGTETDPDHPEIVRVSAPDDPTSLDPNDYFIAGKGGTPVLNCLQAGIGQSSSVCLVLKPSQIHRIFGYDKNTFGIEQIEDGHGIPVSRLAFSINGVVYFWDTNDGPRRSTGGPSEDLSWPLDLQAPEPADLVAAGALADGFCCWLPSRRCLKFIFGRREYQLSLWDPSSLKWTYNEDGLAALSGGVFLTGIDIPQAPPTGAASGVTIAQDGTAATMTVSWQNNGLTGGEVAEVWLHRVNADVWDFVGAAVAENLTQTLDVACVYGTLYEAQVRYRRGAYYTTGYDDPNPSHWPSGSLSPQITTSIAAPVLESVTWYRISATVEQMTVVWTGSLTVESLVYRSDQILPIATVPAGTLSYVDQTIGGETNYTYTVTQKADLESAPSNAITTWAGPNPGLTFDDFSICERGYNASWTTGSALLIQVDLQDLTNSANWYEDFRTSTEPVTHRHIAAVDGGPVPNTVNYGDVINARLRVVATSYGVDDYSPIVTSPSPPAVLFNNTACT